MSTTISDIVKKSGYSKKIVSKVLEGEAVSVKKEARKKILTISKKLGYSKPKIISRFVSRDIGVIVPAMFISPFYHDFYSKLISTALYEAESRGYSLRLVLVRNENKFSDIMNKVKSYKLKGLIIAPDWWAEFFNNKKKLKEINIPVVLLNDITGGKNIKSILLDDFKGGYEGTEYLIKLGHKRIAIYRGFPEDMELRYEGYLKAMSDYGLKAEKKYIIRGVPDENIAGYKNTKKLLKNKIKPTAIFCLGDDMAISTIKALKEFGVKCPKEISVLGYDGIDIGDFISPRLTTMNRPVAEISRLAIQTLLGENKNADKRQIIMPNLIERESCRKIKSKTC